MTHVQVMVTGGGNQAFAMVALALLDPGDRVVLVSICPEMRAVASLPCGRSVIPTTSLTLFHITPVVSLVPSPQDRARADVRLPFLRQPSEFGGVNIRWHSAQQHLKSADLV